MFIGYIRRSQDLEKEVKVFTTSIIDINKTLAPKKIVDIKLLLLKYYQSYYKLFNLREASKLSLYRGPRVDYRIKLELKDSQ